MSKLTRILWRRICGSEKKFVSRPFFGLAFGPTFGSVFGLRSRRKVCIAISRSRAETFAFAIANVFGNGSSSRGNKFFCPRLKVLCVTTPQVLAANRTEEGAKWVPSLAKLQDSHHLPPCPPRLPPSAPTPHHPHPASCFLYATVVHSHRHHHVHLLSVLSHIDTCHA